MRQHPGDQYLYDMNSWVSYLEVDNYDPAGGLKNNGNDFNDDDDSSDSRDELHLYTEDVDDENESSGNDWSTKMMIIHVYFG